MGIGSPDARHSPVFSTSRQRYARVHCPKHVPFTFPLPQHPPTHPRPPPAPTNTTPCLQTFQRERQELARCALESPTDVEMQEAVAAGLERVNLAYLVGPLVVITRTFGVGPWATNLAHLVEC